MTPRISETTINDLSAYNGSLVLCKFLHMLNIIIKFTRVRRSMYYIVMMLVDLISVPSYWSDWFGELDLPSTSQLL